MSQLLNYITGTAQKGKRYLRKHRYLAGYVQSLLTAEQRKTGVRVSVSFWMNFQGLVTCFWTILYFNKWAATWQNQENGMCAQRRLRSAWMPKVWWRKKFFHQDVTKGDYYGVNRDNIQQQWKRRALDCMNRRRKKEVFHQDVTKGDYYGPHSTTTKKVSLRLLRNHGLKEMIYYWIFECSGHKFRKLGTESH